MVHIIRNPCLPFTTTIAGGLYPGRTITIRATPLCGPEKRFRVDLLTCSGTIPMVINPRFGYGGCWQMVLNSSRGGEQWANEERHPNILKIGVPFELQICVEEHRYVLSINGCYFCDFHHREPSCSVNALSITGDVCVEYIKFPDCAPYPPSYGAYGGQPTYTMPMQPPLTNCFEAMKLTSSHCQEFNCPPLPFMAPIYGGFNPPHRIIVVGTPLMCAGRFSINLKNGSEFLFHFNPRFEGCNYVVRNNTRCGAWQMEERAASYFPFVRNQTFSMEICSSGSFYNVTVNGQHFTTFATRDDPCRVNQLTIEGDVSVQKVIIQ